MNNVKAKMRVKTVDPLGDVTGMMVVATQLANRTAGKVGTVEGYVPGHGGDVWWVRHDDDTVAPYTFDEFDEVTIPEHVREIRHANNA